MIRTENVSRQLSVVVLLTAIAVSLPTMAAVFDGGPVVNGIGTGVGGADESIVQTSLGLLYLGFSCNTGSTSATRVADDFVVVNGPWQVDRIVVYGYEANPPDTNSTVSKATLRIWDGPPDEPASSVIFGDTTTDRHVHSEWIGAYRVWESESGNSTQRPIMRIEIEVGTTLADGTYWLDWNVNGDPGGLGFATPFVTINGVTDTGDAMISINGVWEAIIDHGHPQGLPFQVETDVIFASGFEDGTFGGWNPQRRRERSSSVSGHSECP